MRPLKFKLEFIVPGLICQEERTEKLLMGVTSEIGEQCLLMRRGKLVAHC